MSDAGTSHRSLTGFEIALVGLAGRFPGAASVDEFWRNLRNGVESISFFSKEEVARHVDADTLDDPAYVRAFGELKDVELFDASFFGYTPREAELMDPQQRLFLECAWEALEHAGYAPGAEQAPIGVYAGVTMNTYLLTNLLANPELAKSAAGLPMKIAGDKDFLATRVSYKLDLGGPSVVVQTACSTSLVAVHLACQGLLSGDCDMALVGGVSVKVPQRAGYLYQQDGIASPDGHCRAFDEKAQGTVGGSGVAIVVLKRLADAIEDGDLIHAVIKGSAINNDGSNKVGYTAPGVDGQAKVIAAAHAMAEVEPESIGYIETHGTGTSLGDPIEIAALTQCFRAATNKKGFCAVGSVKTNVGHLDAAAGVTSLIKAALALRHGELPPNLHFERPNPRLKIEDSPFYVNATLSTWPDGRRPRRAGVSSFGIGGTNAHVVLEEAPPPRQASASRPWHVLMWSAKTPSALDAASRRLAAHLKAHPDVDLADVAYTLQVGRKVFKHRGMAVCRDIEDALSALGDGASRRVIGNTDEPTERPVTFMFPGQGSQYPNMALELYRHEHVFREQVDRCCELLQTRVGLDLPEVLFPSSANRDAAAKRLMQTDVTQPALMVIEYALARLLMDWGIQPGVMIGHSIGEYVAACLAGVFSLEQGLELVALRGRLMQDLPRGSMLAVPMAAEEISPLLGEDLCLAAVNEPSRCVVSGPTAAVRQLEDVLQQSDVSCRRLHTSHAFHSRIMDDIVDPFAEAVSKIELNPPKIPFVSNVTGTWITDGEATDARYWARQLRQTVLFAAGVGEALKNPDQILLEVGPGRTLTTLAQRQLKGSSRHLVVSSLPHPLDDRSDMAALLDAVGRLWLSGVGVNRSSFYAHQRRHRVPLPTYPFERERYWVEPQDQTRRIAGHAAAVGKKPDMADWFYVPTWRGSVPPAGLASDSAEDADKLRWLLFADAEGIARQIAERLGDRGHEVWMVTDGERFAKVGECAYTIRSGDRDDYEELISLLRRENHAPDRIVHAWAVTPNGQGTVGAEFSERSQDLVFYSLIYLAQALGKESVAGPLPITILSSQMQDVTGEDGLCPEKATLLGPCRVIPKEYPNLICRSVDVVLPAGGSGRERRLVNQLVAELTSKSDDVVIAYRGHHRLTQVFEPARLSGSQFVREDPHPLPLSREREKGVVPARRLRERGVYLITGGLGGIGLAVAEHLAKTVRARLVLVGRSAFPEKEAWPRWLSSHGGRDTIGRKIGKLQALEESGAEVLLQCADVSDAEQMREVIDRAKGEFGRIDGVIHAAGLPDGTVIHRRTREDMQRVLAPKLEGTLVLDRLLKDEGLDFFVICSSLASILGPVGQVAYTAANAFLDAFARYKTATDGTYTVSIDWDTWREVGMAVEASKQLAAAGSGGYAPPTAETHPLLDHRIQTGADGVIFVSNFSVDRHWVLDEHRVKGTALLPGTGYVELACAAFESLTGNETAEIREIYFLRPLTVGEHEQREVHTVLTGREEGFEFVIKSRATAAGGEWEEHARGEIVPAPVHSGQVLDIEEFEARAEKLSEHKEPIQEPLTPGPSPRKRGEGRRFSDRHKTARSQYVEIGPRWDNIAATAFVAAEGIARLELPAAFSADTESYRLHPALMDAATSFMAGRFRGDEIYLPFGYKGLKVFATLPRKVVSHMECLQQDAVGSDTLRFRVTIADPQGTELVSIDEYTLRKVDAGKFAAGEFGAGEVRKKDRAPSYAEAREPADLLRHGMSPVEGVEAFDRILSTAWPVVLISTQDLQTRVEQGDSLGTDRFRQSRQPQEDTGRRHPRPQLRTTYAAATSETERMLVDVWQSLLGIERVGVEDSFLEIGGDSLLATQVTTRIRKQFHIEFPISALFEDQTIAALAVRIEEMVSASSVPQDDREASSADREEVEF